MLSALRVFLVDDHPFLTDGIRSYLFRSLAAEVVGSASGGREALAGVAETRPDIAVVDLSLPDMSGVELLGLLREHHPEVACLVYAGEGDAGRVQECLRAGARGFLLKSSPREDLVRALQCLGEGDIFIDARVGGRYASDLRAPWGEGGELRGELRGGQLGRREQEVLQLVSRGYSNKEIAHLLGVGVKTIETHRARACGKLSLRSRAEIVLFASSRGWLSGN